MSFPDNALFQTNNQREKQSVADAITNFLSDEYVMKTIDWSWDRLSVTRITDSHFDNLHRPAAMCLSRLIRHPDFLKIRSEQSIPATSSFQVDEQGHLFNTHENVSSRTVDSEDVTVGFFSTRTDITHFVVGIESFEEDLQLLASMAKLTGGWVTATEKMAVGQWLRVHGLPLPTTVEGAKELIDLINNSTLPDSPPYDDYWQLMDSPADSPFNLTEENRAIIRRVSEEQTAGEVPLVTLLGDSLRLESGSADGLPTSQSYRMARLIDIAVWASGSGQEYLDALGWFADENGPKPTEQFIEQLIIAAMLLDLDPDAERASTTFAGFDLYSKRYLLVSPAEVRAQLERHLVATFKLNEVFAPLVAELVLSGMAPEYLVRDVPSELRVGTPAWVVFTQTVHFAESIVPGVSRSMTYQHLLGFARVSELTPETKTLFASHSTDPVITWALTNRLIARDAEGNLSQEAITLALEEYRQHVDMMTNALNELGKPLPHRKPLALKELTSQVPDCDPDELLVKHRGTGGGAGRKVSVLDLYMGDELDNQDWDRATGKSIYQSFPDLAHLYPVANLYEHAIHNHHNAIMEAMAATINIAFSQLRPLDRQFIEDGHLGVYCVQEHTTTRFPELPNPGHIVRPLTSLPGKTGRYGVLLCAVLDSKIRCYELFPLRMECKFSEELSDAIRPLVTANDFVTEANFVDQKELLRAPLDMRAYRENIEPRNNARSDLFILKIGEFKASANDADSTSPNRYFRSERKETISTLIAEKNPHFTEVELRELGLDSTQREKAIEKTDAVFNVILNLIIPFKGCIEDMTSGDPSKQRGALLGCVMDAAVLLVSFAVIGVKIVAISAKAATLVSKLLSASKVAASTVVGLFNPISGVPQLLKGGAKLLGRGVIKLSGSAFSASHAARQQLRYFTGANSYDLIKAIDHTGSAPRIRMSLDTVAHGRALFKDDSIETVEQILTRLGNKGNRLPEGASPVELEHLFNKAVVESTTKLKQAQDLESLTSRSAVDEVFKVFQKEYKLGYSNVRSASDAQGYVDVLTDFARIETKNVTYVKNYQQNVLTKDLGKAPYNQFMPESTFNPNGYTDNAQRAGAWIMNGSTSKGNNVDDMVAVLREYAGNKKSLTDPAVIKEVHRRMAPASANVVRVRNDGQIYPSNISGFAAMEQHLKTLNTGHEHFDKHLLATVVGFHGLGDGNGRTGRALYAISQLRNNRFTPLTKNEFSLLHGLD
ncbi:hypothetical protein PMI21_02484 [Pseudomonas sp. GM18]|uniref:hypothetical protein n=1 Tax=Pseudomonas sp. GM18 TaxID=1144324 RepID=UPI000272308B|nr:hypothetical protein [Pseudomonas sp. GM18]EJM17775.1 hypothetical protein PMI21_02484 [Pseudomonas sp. GM18]